MYKFALDENDGEVGKKNEPFEAEQIKETIETKKNPLKSLKVKSMALFGASPTPDMQLSRFAAELASGLFLRLRRFYGAQPSWFYFLCCCRHVPFR